MITRMTRDQLARVFTTTESIRFFEELINTVVELQDALSQSGVLVKKTQTLTNSAGAFNATLTNAPTAGNPTKWININDNGTIRRIPSW